MIGVVAKVAQFRGESRFTTWACKFAIFEVSTKIGRHFWQRPTVAMDAEDWDRLPDRFGLDPARVAEWRDVIAALRRAVDDELTDRQRRIFVAIVLNGIPLDALVVELGSSRNAIYKTLFDARRKLRASSGHSRISGRRRFEAGMSSWGSLERFLRTDPADAGCAETFELLDRYVERELAHGDAASSYPGIAAHLSSCNPCVQDFEGLLAAIAVQPARLRREK